MTPGLPIRASRTTICESFGVWRKLLSRKNTARRSRNPRKPCVLGSRRFQSERGPFLEASEAGKKWVAKNVGIIFRRPFFVFIPGRFMESGRRTRVGKSSRRRKNWTYCSAKQSTFVFAFLCGYHLWLRRQPRQVIRGSHFGVRVQASLRAAAVFGLPAVG